MDAFVAQKFARDGQAAPQGQRPQVQPQPVWLGPMQQSQSIPEAQVLQAPPVYYSYAAPPPPSLGAPVAGGYGPAAVPLLHPDDQLTCCAPSRSYIPFPVHPLCQCGPVAYQPVPEYGSGKCGRRVICGRTTFEQRDCLGRPCTPHRMLTLAACIILIATSIITGLSSAKSIPWYIVSTYNGTSADPVVWVYTDTYAASGSVQTSFCPYSSFGTRFPRSSSSLCVKSPAGYAAPTLSQLSPASNVDAGGAHRIAGATSATATALDIAALLVLALLIVPTATLPYPGTARVLPVSLLVCGYIAALLCAIALQSASVGVWQARVEDRLLSNPSYVVAGSTASTGPQAFLPQPSLLGRGAGQGLCGASIALAVVAGALVSVAALTSPAWFRGSRAAWYAKRWAQLQEYLRGGGDVAAAVPPGVVVMMPGGGSGARSGVGRVCF